MQTRSIVRTSRPQRLVGGSRLPMLALVALLAAPALLSTSGCGPSMVVNKHMALVADNQVPDLAADRARVVFIRPERTGFNVASSVFNVTSGEPKLIGIASFGTRMAYDVDPGAHRFMVIGENADFLQANLEAGKTYFVMVKVRMGWWKARFGLRPISAAMMNKSPYREWIHDGKWIENTDSAAQWANNSDQSIRARMDRYLPRWEAKTNKPTLHPEDGI